jgi:transposase
MRSLLCSPLGERRASANEAWNASLCDSPGLTPKRYQSGEVDIGGRMSKAGDRMMRSLLFEAANAIVTRLRRDNALRRWGLRLTARVGARKSKVAVARKLSIILHRIWLDGSEFRPVPTI